MKEPFVHRDLSWIQFNERVLSQAFDDSNPLLERLKFIGITASNLDEFFMVRFSSMRREILNLEKSGDKPKELKRLTSVHDDILNRVTAFFKRQNLIYRKLSSELSSSGVHIFSRERNDEKLLSIGKQIFDSECLSCFDQPLLDLDKNTLGEVKNLQSALLFTQSKKMLPIPRNLPHLFWRQVSKNQIAIFFLDALFLEFSPKLLGPSSMIRLTRDADIAVDLQDEDTASVPDYIKRRMSARERGRPVRLQFKGNLKPLEQEKLRQELKLSSAMLFDVKTPLSIHGAFQFVNAQEELGSSSKNLLYPKFKPYIPKSLRKPAQIFKELASKDYLLHHPYDSFDAYVNFIKAAVSDPQVESIQQTVYRVDTLSEVVDLLKDAAKKGKKVRVFIEPRARFDELNNVQLAEDLRDAGCDVVFSFNQLKMHAKIALIERKEGVGTTFYTHLSTGNYNAKTARAYTDFGILTACQITGRDAKRFFDACAIGKMPVGFKNLLIAPTMLHRKMLSHIQLEIAAAKAGKRARIFAKINALVDPEVVTTLYEASKAGVQVDLVVRGACSLIPGIPGLSEKIRVVSIVDRFLEHSRIYHFESSNVIYLSSADWMPRNFFSRLEIAFPLLDQRLFKYMKETVFPIYMNDNQKSKILRSDGTWRSNKPKSSKETIVRAQGKFLDLASSEYKKTALIS